MMMEDLELTLNPYNMNEFGYIQILGANPAAGSNYTKTANTGLISQPALLSFRIITDANVANRTIMVYHARGAASSYLGTYPQFVVANSDIYFSAFVGAPAGSSVLTSVQPLAIAEFPFFLPTDSIGIGLHNIQAGDTITSIRIYWKTWPYKG
jgi:hypothetical protein